MDKLLSVFAQVDDTYIHVYQAVLRYLIPALAAILLFRAVRPLLTFRREPEIWAWLELGNRRKLPITHWENVIGRRKLDHFGCRLQKRNSGKWRQGRYLRFG